MMFFIFPACILHASLFITSHQQSSWEKAQSGKIEQTQKKARLILNGILYRADTHEWIIWINGQVMSSNRQKSIHGWTVIHVSIDTVTLQSHTGEVKKLMVEQMDESSQSEEAPDHDSEDQANEELSTDADDDEMPDDTKNENAASFDEIESIDGDDDSDLERSEHPAPPTSQQSLDNTPENHGKGSDGHRDGHKDEATTRNSTSREYKTAAPPPALT